MPNWLNASELSSSAKSTLLLTTGFASAIPNGDIRALKPSIALPVGQPSLLGSLAIDYGMTEFSK
jgi:hypothetical protein